MTILSTITNLILSSPPKQYDPVYFNQINNQLATFGLKVSRFINQTPENQSPWTSTTTFTPDFIQASVFIINPSENMTVNNPSNILGNTGAASGAFIINQAVSTSTVTFDTYYSFATSLPSPVASSSLVILYQTISTTKVILNPLGNYI